MKEKKLGSDTVYFMEIDGVEYCYQYPLPDTHDGGKHFSGTAYAWEKGSLDQFAVCVSVKAEEIDNYWIKVQEKIKEHIKVNG